MGHTAQLPEEAGTPTVIIAVRAFQATMAQMTLPRALMTPHIMGRPLGAPGDRERHRETILAALDLFRSAAQVGTVAELSGQYHPARRESNRGDLACDLDRR